MALETDQATLPAGTGRRLTVADAMVTEPTVHPRSTTVDELRTFFRDDHVHMALIADGDKLIGTVERADLTPALSGDLRASTIARLEGRTAGPDVPLPVAFAVMTGDGRRRLAVTSDDSLLLGLLCLKSSGLGFCSDSDAVGRR
jgi:CBS domain-containing protein